MEDKDKPNIFNGKGEILFSLADSDLAHAVPLGEVVADSLTILGTDEENDTIDPIMVNTLSFRGMTELNPSIHDIIDKLVEESSCSIFDIMFDGFTPNSIQQFVIKNFPEPVRKPSNLKYPNKKRKMRVLKKWCKRYGWKHGQYLVIPRARCNGVVLKDGVPTISYTAENISE